MIKPQISSRNLNYELTNLNFIMFCQIFHFANEFKSLLKRRNNFFLIIHNLSLKNLNLFKLKIFLVGHFVHKGTEERFLAVMAATMLASRSRPQLAFQCIYISSLVATSYPGYYIRCRPRPAPPPVVANLLGNLEIFQED